MGADQLFPYKSWSVCEELIWYGWYKGKLIKELISFWRADQLLKSWQLATDWQLVKAWQLFEKLISSSEADQLFRSWSALQKPISSWVNDKEDNEFSIHRPAGLMPSGKKVPLRQGILIRPTVWLHNLSVTLIQEIEFWVQKINDLNHFFGIWIHH